MKQEKVTLGGLGGTQEAKRRIKAAPPPDLFSTASGCFVGVLVYLGVCISWFALTRSSIPIILAGPGIVLFALVLARLLYGRLLLSRVLATWSPRGIRCLLVHSNSDLWKQHIASQWIPRFGDLAVKLNWSERSTWPNALEAQVFKHFCSAQRNFNPAVVVFRGLRQPLVFRFYYAFREASIGRKQYLDEQEKRLFESLGV